MKAAEKVLSGLVREYNVSPADHTVTVAAAALALSVESQSL